MNLRNALFFLAKLALAAAIFALLVRKMDFSKFEAAWLAVSLPWVLPALAVKLAGILAGVFRWRWLLRGQGLEVGVPHLLGSFLVGRFIGLVVPGTVGLDGYRAYDIARHARAPAKSIAVILVEKVIGFFALGLLILVTLPGGGAFLPTQALLFIAVAFVLPVTLALGILLRPGAVEGIARSVMPRALGLREKVGAAAAAAGAYADRRSILLVATGFGLMVHACTVVMYLFLVRAVGVSVEVTDMLFVGPLIVFATAVPLSLSGFGIREGTLVFLLSRIGVSTEQAVVLGLLAFACSEVWSVLGGVVFLLRGRDYAPQIAELRAGVRADRLGEAEAAEAAPPSVSGTATVEGNPT